jgi:hypothetical protein
VILEDMADIVLSIKNRKIQAEQRNFRKNEKQGIILCLLVIAEVSPVCSLCLYVLKYNKRCT